MNNDLQIAVDTIGEYLIENSSNFNYSGQVGCEIDYRSISHLKKLIDSFLQKGLFDYYQFYFVGKDICIKLISDNDSYEFLVNQLIRDHKIKLILK